MLTKALDDEDTGLEMEHYVAHQLHMTVAGMRAEMPEWEYVRWTRYFARKWQREEVARQMAGG
jgi:hypothetical protein